jgi:3-phenylpropionate/cinnamic acid dioxygenase small subunit
MADASESSLQHALARIARLEDERAILDCVYGYSHALDGKQPDEFLEGFTDDGRFAWKPTPDVDYAIDLNGRAELERWVLDYEPRVPPGREHHVVTNPRIVAVDGDRARAVSWYLIIRDFGGRPGVRSTGRYLDELERGPDGRWRIRERLALGDMPR